MQNLARIGTALLAVLVLAAGCSGSSRTPDVSAPSTTSPAQVPTGQAAPAVDPALMGQLRNELTRVLSARGITLDANGNPVGKAVSSVPKREYLFPDRFNDIINDQVSLSWIHYMQGDYDYNGEVNVSDLTPIGVYYGATSADPDWGLARRADGDGNGEVNIADVTPIGQNFGAKLAGYVIQWRFDINEEWSDYGFMPFNAALVQQGNGEMGYSAPSALLADDFRIAPVPDVREFHWTSYQLDDNSSSYEYVDLAYHDQTPTLAFIDSGLGQLMFAHGKELHPMSAADWDIGVVDSQSVLAQQPQLRIYGGVPSIAYVGNDPSLFFELRFARVMQLTPPTTTAQIHTIKGQLPNNPPAFIYKDGLPVVGYSDTGSYKLYASSLGVPSSTTDWDVIDTGQAMNSVSLALVANKVDFAGFKYASPSQLLFGRSLIDHPNGPLDFDSYNIDFIGGLAETPSIYSVGGYPCVAADNYDNAAVDFLRPTVLNPSALAMWTPHQVYTDPSQTANPDLILVDGRPAVCFGRTTLNFAWASSEAPQQASDWLVTTNVEGDVNFNAYPPSVLEVDGLPIIAYIQYNPQDSTRHVYIAVASEE